MNKLKKIRFEDIIAMFVFPIALVISKFKRYRKREIWLICESGFEARDNGYWLYKHICEKHPEKEVIYVITKDSPDFNKINSLGKYVEYKSFKHWILYFAATVNISSHKAGNPNAAVCYVLEVYFNLSKNRIFLQHGITLSDAKWLYKNKTNFVKYICGAKPEYEYILEKFGYEEDELDYVGFCRFDTLVDSSQEKKIIIMPSWRNWLVNHSDDEKISEKEISNFIESNYFKYWNDFISDTRLLEFCKLNNIKIGFFPHRNMQPFLSQFNGNSYVSLISWKDADIQELLRESSLLITDYSSVSLDFSYMNKPVIYYQFDIADFREKQYEKGYFDYKEDGFGPLIETKEELIPILIELNNNNFKNPINYTKKLDSFFELRDSENCARTFESIDNFIKKEGRTR